MEYAKPRQIEIKIPNSYFKIVITDIDEDMREAEIVSTVKCMTLPRRISQRFTANHTTAQIHYWMMRVFNTRVIGGYL